MMGPDPGIDLDPRAARTAGARVHDAGEGLSAVRDSAGARLAAANDAKPWGSDEMGTAFAAGKDGKDGWLSAAESLLAAWRSYGARTADLGVEIVTAVDQLTGADEAGEAQVRGTLRQV